VQIDTTNPPGQERAAADYLAAFFAESGIQVRVIEPAPGRANLLARLPANRPDGSGAILLLSHMDVVPADPAAWSFAPLSGAIRDGAVYGRGALDDKGHGAVFAEALALLKASDAPRRRDLVFCATADEEVFGDLGAAYMVAHHWDELGPPVVVWNEGGASSRVTNLGGLTLNGIASTEKRVLWLHLIAEGEGGHGSQPVRDAANDRLVRALERVLAWETPLRASSAVVEQMRRVGERLDFPLGLALRSVDNPLLLQLFSGFFTGDRLTNAMLRDTISLTMLESGLKHNVIPRRARAALDIRLLPDTDAAAFLEELAAVIDDPGIRIERVEQELPEIIAGSPVDNELFRAIELEMARELPGSVTVPLQTTGGTDSLYFRRRGVPAYGFLPALLDGELNRSIHGLDERLPLAELERSLRVTTRVLERLVVPQDPATQ
jgi:acetylornithine deacetylase/succinyl-diaminopimelate desuccinylase-like protein